MATRGARKPTGNNPFRTDSSSGKSGRSVDLGVPGETPKKFLAFNQTAPPSDIQSILNSQSLPRIDESPTVSSPEAVAVARENIAIATSGLDRPKTSRGKALPSPDEFFNYVIPSPDTGKIKSNRILIHPSSSSTKKTLQSLKQARAETDEEIEIDDATSHTTVSSNGKRSYTTGTTQTTEGDTRSRSVSVSSSTRLADNYMLGLDMNNIPRDKQVALLGCWLFGSALKI